MRPIPWRSTLKWKLLLLPFFRSPIFPKISLISDLSLFSKSSNFFRIRPWELLSDALPDVNLVSLIDSKSPSRDGKLSMMFANSRWNAIFLLETTPVIIFWFWLIWWHFYNFICKFPIFNLDFLIICGYERLRSNARWWHFWWWLSWWRWHWSWWKFLHFRNAVLYLGIVATSNIKSHSCWKFCLRFGYDIISQLK